MPYTSLSPLLSNPLSSLSTAIPTVPPQSLSSLCTWWESTHAKDVPLPHICQEYTSPDKLLNGYVAPPMQYNFARVASEMLMDNGKMDILPVEHATQGAGRSIGLAGIGMGVLFILLIIAFISCMKRRKTVQTVNQDDLSNSQVVLTLQAVTDTTKRDFPPDYNTVVRIRKGEEEEDLPSYGEAIEQEPDIINRKDGSLELPLEIEVYSDSLKCPPNRIDCESFDIVKQHEMDWEKH